MTAEQGTEYRVLAERLVQYVADLSGEQLDFTPASLTTLDALFAEWRDLASVYGGAEPPDLTGFAEPVAAYLGMVLIGTLGGVWEDAAATPGQGPTLVLDGRTRVALVPTVLPALIGRAPLFDQYQALVAELERETP